MAEGSQHVDASTGASSSTEQLPPQEGVAEQEPAGKSAMKKAGKKPMKKSGKIAVKKTGKSAIKAASKTAGKAVVRRRPAAATDVVVVEAFGGGAEGPHEELLLHGLLEQHYD